VNERLPKVLRLLERLVAFDTQNPPQKIVAGEGIFRFIRDELGPSFSIVETDLGGGCISLLAVRGAPSLVFNAHVDTVPFGEGWTRDPLKLVVENDRAIGRGAADVKGASACMLAAAARTKGDVALLFTTEEEAGSSRPVNDFLSKKPSFRGAIVSEPTRCEAVVEHRGIATATARFTGTPGHASDRRALEDSALHEAVRWASAALAFAEENEARTFRTLSGIRFNVGVVEGGTKTNMIAGAASVRFGVRPLPDQDPEGVIRSLAELAPHSDRASFELGFVARALPGVDRSVEPAVQLANELGLRRGEPVDFWTEAALFSEARIPALVYGPGDIRQAHTKDEWIHLASLYEAFETYARLFTSA
jgi:acetylornithine deacetylase